MNRRKHFRLFAALLGLAASVSCGKGAEVNAASPPSNAAVATSGPASGTPVASAPSPQVNAKLPNYIASGPIVVENQVDVEAQRDGIVSEILADTGKAVRKGQLLARLDDRQLRAELASHEADLHATEANHKRWQSQALVAQADFERAQAMFKASLITKEQLDHARYTREAAGFEADREGENRKFFEAKMRETELEMEKTRIVAPFSGVVARRYIRAGQKVAPNDRLFWVTAVSPLRVRFTLPQEFLGKIRSGSQLGIDAPAGEAQPHFARVVSVSPVVDPSSGTIEVLAQIAGKAADLHPGMTVKIRMDEQINRTQPQP